VYGAANIWLPADNRFYVYKLDQLVNNLSIDPEIKLKEFKETAKNDHLKEMEDFSRMSTFFYTLSKVYIKTVDEIWDELGIAYHVLRPGGTVFINSGDSIGFQKENNRFGDRYGIFAFNGKKISIHIILEQSIMIILF
jgi:hypothetical protein